MPNRKLKSKEDQTLAYQSHENYYSHNVRPIIHHPLDEWWVGFAVEEATASGWSGLSWQNHSLHLTLPRWPSNEVAYRQLSCGGGLIHKMCTIVLCLTSIEAVLKRHQVGWMEWFHFNLKLTIVRKKSAFMCLPSWEVDTAGTQWLCWSPGVSVLAGHSTPEHFTASWRPIEVGAGCAVKAGLLTLRGILRII